MSRVSLERWVAVAASPGVGELGEETEGTSPLGSSPFQRDRRFTLYSPVLRFGHAPSPASKRDRSSGVRVLRGHGGNGEPVWVCHYPGLPFPVPHERRCPPDRVARSKWPEGRPVGDVGFRRHFRRRRRRIPIGQHSRRESHALGGSGGRGCPRTRRILVGRRDSAVSGDAAGGPRPAVVGLNHNHPALDENRCRRTCQAHLVGHAVV